MRTSKTRRKPTQKSPQPRAAVLHDPLIERKGPFRNLIEIPGMEGRVLKRVQIFTTTAYHSLTLDFEDQTSLTLVLDPCFFVTASLSDISSGNGRTLRCWPKIKSTTSGD